MLTVITKSEKCERKMWKPFDGSVVIEMANI